MAGFDFIDSLGGTSRLITILTFFIHFIHPLFCLATYLHWVRHQRVRLGNSIVDGYLGLTILASIFYLFIASVFYMWAWRFPEPEEVSKRRRIYGVIINLLFSDIPLFVIETKIVWEVQFADGLQGFTYVLTCLSLFYSALRVWTFFMVKLIKIRAPVVGAQSHFAGSRSYQGQHMQQQQQEPQNDGYYPQRTTPDRHDQGMQMQRYYPGEDGYGVRDYSEESAGQGPRYGPGAYPSGGGGGGRGYAGSSPSWGGQGMTSRRGGSANGVGSDFYNSSTYGQGPAVI